MSTSRNCSKRMFGVAIPTAIAVVAIASGAAWAQTYVIEGSDTMTNLVNDAIAASGARLTYRNIGSGQAEKDMASLPGQLVLQGIGPMSRNFVASLLSPHPNWQPTDANVVCLDGPVVVVNSSKVADSSFCRRSCPKKLMGGVSRGRFPYYMPLPCRCAGWLQFHQQRHQ